MNFGAIMPKPNIMTSRPVKVSARGNMYKIPITHMSTDGQTTNKYEVWATKEAVQKHFYGLNEEPKEYHLRKFARQLYEKQMRSSKGALPQRGILATSDSVTHGNPVLWPNNLSHPEVKI